MPSAPALAPRQFPRACVLFVVLVLVAQPVPTTGLRLPGADELTHWVREHVVPARHSANSGPLLSSKSKVVEGIGTKAPLTTQSWQKGSSTGPGPDTVQTVFNGAALAALRRAARRAQHDQQQQVDQQLPWLQLPRHSQQPPPQQQQQTIGTDGVAAALDSDQGATFDLDLARLLARMQTVSYCSDHDAVRNWTCTRCPTIPGFQATVSHFDAAWDLSGYAGYLPAYNAKVIVFRGTDSSSWYNWIENMRAWRTDATYPVPGAPKAMRIHSGFLILWNSSSMATTFKAAYANLLAAHPTGPTFVVGHSMGGALAHLCALDLRAAFDPQDLRVFTFGSPRVGNGVFADFFDEHVAQSWRFTHGRDIVPSLPPATLLGFRHTAREVWLVDLEPGQGGGGGGASGLDERIIMCDESGEDPTCHNSVCHLGLCTSIADHLMYLDTTMYAGDC